MSCNVHNDFDCIDVYILRDSDKYCRHLLNTVMLDRLDLCHIARITETSSLNIKLWLVSPNITMIDCSYCCHKYFG
jgi:hypothetical protein